MKYTITHLNDTTIICFQTGALVIVDENLEQWVASPLPHSYPWIKFINPPSHPELLELFIRPDGTQKWYNAGLLHRKDGPAFIRINGEKEWWISGLRQ